jgi:hypothetical protein
LFTTNPIRLDLVSNPVCRSGNPSTNLLICGCEYTKVCDMKQ